MTDVTASSALSDAPIMKPPRSQVGPIAWLRDKLFSSVGNTLLTIFGFAIAYFAVKGLVTFAVLDATWIAKDGADCAKNDGACWPFVFAKFGQFMFGRYPDAQPSLDGYHGLVLLGGPMSVYDTGTHPHAPGYPYIAHLPAVAGVHQMRNHVVHRQAV